MSKRPASSGSASSSEMASRSGRVARRAKPARRHVVRILAVVLGAIIYLPAMALMTIQVAGGTELQELFDWLTGRCGATCSTREALATAIQIAPIVVTGPVLALIGFIWVKRGYRDDRRIGAIEHDLATAPDRVSPYAVDEDETNDRYLYRDRQGRLRPVYAPDRSASASDPQDENSADRLTR